jgi:hypothetical protein
VNNKLLKGDVITIIEYGKFYLNPKTLKPQKFILLEDFEDKMSNLPIKPIDNKIEAKEFVIGDCNGN